MMAIDIRSPRCIGAVVCISMLALVSSLGAEDVGRVSGGGHFPLVQLGFAGVFALGSDVEVGGVGGAAVASMRYDADSILLVGDGGYTLTLHQATPRWFGHLGVVFARGAGGRTKSGILLGTKYLQIPSVYGLMVSVGAFRTATSDDAEYQKRFSHPQTTLTAEAGFAVYWMLEFSALAVYDFVTERPGFRFALGFSCPVGPLSLATHAGFLVLSSDRSYPVQQFMLLSLELGTSMY